MKQIIWTGLSIPPLNFDGIINFNPYRAMVDDQKMTYFDEPEGQWETYLKNAPYDLVDYANIFKAHRENKLRPGLVATGFLSYPIFKSGWWYRPWEWLIKFPYRVYWFLHHIPGPVYAGIQVSGGWAPDIIVPRWWMVRYCKWIWRIFAGRRLWAYAYWSWDFFDGLKFHPELIKETGS